MSVFTLDEYKFWLLEHTALFLTVKVEDEPPAEVLTASLDGTIEVLRAPAVRQLAMLGRYLPRYLRADNPLFRERCRLLQRLQQPLFVQERVARQHAVIAEWFALAYGADGDVSMPSECAVRHFRRLRANLAEMVFSLDDVTIGYWYRLLFKSPGP